MINRFKIFSKIVLFAMTSSLFAVNVTLNVDMSNVTVSEDGVHVAGSFQGWDPAGTPLADDDGDGVNNADDLCPSTISGIRVTENGCPDLILLDETSNEASEGNNLLAITLFSLSILVIIIALIIYVRNTKSQP